MTSELKECPFCGGEAELIRCGTGRQSAQVSCTQCNCHHESSGQGLRSGDAWNTRTPPELPPVSPEDLVEGEWYAWKSAGNIHVGQVYSCGTDSTYIRCGATGIPVMDWNLYYGPLKFEIGGAE